MRYEETGTRYAMVNSDRPTVRVPAAPAPSPAEVAAQIAEIEAQEASLARRKRSLLRMAAVTR